MTDAEYQEPVPGATQAVRFYRWVEELGIAAKGAVDGELLPQGRKKWEKRLLELTTPAQCLDAVQFINVWFPEEKLHEQLGKTARKS